MKTVLHYATEAGIALLAGVGVVELLLFLFGGILTDTTVCEDPDELGYWIEER